MNYENRDQKETEKVLKIIQINADKIIFYVLIKI